MCYNMDKENLSVSNEVKDMKTIINQIISIENQENEKFMEYQRKRIKELKETIQRKMNGETVDINNILDDLKHTGILDKKNLIL